MAREILIIRHGETSANATRVVQTPDASLSEQGRVQVERLAQHLAGTGVERILTSDLARARQTAEAIRERTRAPVYVDSLLQERNYGELRGTPYTELGGRDIFAYDFAPPGGETGAAFDARVDVAWAAIRTHAGAVGGRLAVVTHGLVCASLVSRHFDGASPPEGWGNTSVTIVDGRPPWRVVRLASTEHLEGLAPEAGRV